MTLPYSSGRRQDFSFGGLGDKTHSTEFSCAKSEGERTHCAGALIGNRCVINHLLFLRCAVSVDSITEEDRRALMAADMPASSTYSGQINYHYPQPGLLRRSLPNMAHSILVHEPAKIYPYHLLLITNYRLPSDVDRCNLEVGDVIFYWCYE